VASEYFPPYGTGECGNMSFKEYFEMGKKSEMEYERKKQLRKAAPKKLAKPAPFSPAGIIVGLGVLYQMVVPKFRKPSTISSQPKASTMKVIKADIKMVVMRIRGFNENWEKYLQFESLARKGMK
jgi:hypothetical protein